LKKIAGASSRAPAIFEGGRVAKSEPFELATECVNGVVVELDGHARRGERERQGESKKDGLHWDSPFQVLTWALTTDVGHVRVRKSFGHGGRGRGDDQGQDDQKLLHFESPSA
jgi:hypothetical protein